MNTEKNDIMTEEIPEKLRKRLHFVAFTIKILIIGVLAFIAIQLSFSAIIGLGENAQDNDLLGHNYCGTFFFDHTIENTFLSDKAYEEYSEDISYKKENDKLSPVISVLSISIIIICLFLLFRNAEKNQFFSKHSSKWLIISGTIWAVLNIICQIHKYIDLNIEIPYLAGVPATSHYYCQLYIILGIPALIILSGLILRQYETSFHGNKTNGSSVFLKAYALLFTMVSFGFLIYRFCIRTYELIMCTNGFDYEAQLPFYYRTFELPQELAESGKAYTDIIVLRFVKDLPVFLASGFTIIMLDLIMLSAAKNKIHTKKNSRRFFYSIVLLIISSLLFNALGLCEVSLFNKNFNGIYGSVTYTIGIRALCEPALFALVLWFVYTLTQIVPENHEIPSERLMKEKCNQY